jgi:hypothetical protein
MFETLKKMKFEKPTKSSFALFLVIAVAALLIVYFISK